MREVVLYIAVSLDGFIADKEGKIDWLLKYDAAASSYATFIDSVDTLVMGKTTYKQLATELSPDVWPYPDKQVFVASRGENTEDSRVTFTSDPVELIRKQKELSGKDIWIVGGSQLVKSLMDALLIDIVRLTIVPVSIGSGIPLFLNLHADFNLEKTERFGPFAELTFRVINR